MRYVDENLPLLGLHNDLDFATTSYEVGVKKPDETVFHAERRRATHARRLLFGEYERITTPGELLHNGDDPKNDYLAATKRGMNALLFDPSKR